MKTLSCAVVLLFACLSALAEDGKVFVKSEPPGATMTLMVDGKPKKELEKKTPALIELPRGKQLLLVTLDGYLSDFLEVEVGDGIAKPDPVKLYKVKFDIDVVFDDGWAVYIDKQPAKDKDNKPAVTPCTLAVPLGSHEIALVKDGFNDIVQRNDVKAKDTLEIKSKPVKGNSALLKPAKAVHAEPEKKEAPPVDLDKITADQWNALQGEIVTVPANSPSFDTKIDLATGQKAWIIPNPADRIKIAPSIPYLDFKGKGAADPTFANPELPMGCLCFRIGDKKEDRPQKYGLAADTGRIYLMVNDSLYGDNTGQIKVKIVIVRP